MENENAGAFLHVFILLQHEIQATHIFPDLEI
jgi:hypothetical protein